MESIREIAPRDIGLIVPRAGKRAYSISFGAGPGSPSLVRTSKPVVGLA